MRDVLDGWLRRKLRGEPFRPLRERTISRQWERLTGRMLFGSVTLRVSPADEFSFVDNAAWPLNDADEYSEAVLDGILDALLLDVCEPPGGAQFVLEAIEWRPVASVPHGYKQAAREAVGDLYGLDQRERLGFADDDAVLPQFERTRCQPRWQAPLNIALDRNHS